MASFGLDTDHFSLADTNLSLVSSSKTPHAKQTAEARDSEGNIAALSFYGTVTLYDIECTYALKAGTQLISGIKIGPKTGTVVMQSLSGTTSNSAWPQITASGITGAVDTDSMPSFTAPAITLTAAKTAQGIGFTKGAACALTGSSFTFSGELAEQLDSAGNVAAQAFTGAMFEASGDFVEVTGAATWTIDTTYGLTEVQAPSSGKGNTEYGTGTGTASRFVAADT